MQKTATHVTVQWIPLWKTLAARGGDLLSLLAVILTWAGMRGYNHAGGGIQGWRAADRLRRARGAEEGSVQSMRPKKVILCVDDNEQALAVRKFLLETRGYRVIPATDGATAIEILQQGGIDMVVSDLVMPQMDGNSMIGRMKQIMPEVPMMLISGTVKAFDRANRADAFLPKGCCTPVEMLERIRVMIARKRGPRKVGSRPAYLEPGGEMRTAQTAVAS